MRLSLERSASFKRLSDHARDLTKTSLRALFADDAKRFARFSIEDDGLLFDYSKNKITAKTVSLLTDLARERGLAPWRERLFAGETVNGTENRAALHMALRAGETGSWRANGEDARPLVAAALARMKAFTRKIHDGLWRGHTGEAIRTVVHIGIGGSDLGPRMMVRALTPYARPGVTVRFVANIDGADMQERLSRCDPRSTLFIVASKSFATQETLTNAWTARDWLISALGEEAAARKHFVAVSTAREKAEAFGIHPDNIFEIWDWVGGRYSLWSAIGLPIALALGWDAFEHILAGARAMDEHFRAAPFERNIPVLMALLGVWNANVLGAPAHAVLPYGRFLSLLPAYLQQLDMESNGKRVACDGAPIEGLTGPILFGQEGVNGQHSFYQSIHQGSRLISSDFIVAAEDRTGLGGHHARLSADALAQTEALMRGKTLSEARDDLRANGASEEEAARLAPHMVFPGDKPCNTLLARRFDPRTMGRLAALYEHKIVAQGALWDVNSFDQMGVELGKQFARRILPELLDGGAPAGGHDSSTGGLIDAYKRFRAS